MTKKRPHFCAPFSVVLLIDESDSKIPDLVSLHVAALLKHFFTSNLNSLFLSAAALHQGYFLGKVNSLDVIELVKIPDMETKNWRHGCLLKNPQLPCANRPYIIIGQNLRRGI